MRIMTTPRRTSTASTRGRRLAVPAIAAGDVVDSTALSIRVMGRHDTARPGQAFPTLSDKALAESADERRAPDDSQQAAKSVSAGPGLRPGSGRWRNGQV